MIYGCFTGFPKNGGTYVVCWGCIGIMFYVKFRALRFNGRISGLHRGYIGFEELGFRV